MKKLKLKRGKKGSEAPSRITNETVAEHREQILAGGRRFKYPHQIAKHKLVFNAIVIALATVVVMAGVTYWQLYLGQNTSTFFYRVTRIVPMSVASVDGERVRYSDYLMSLSGSQHYLEQTERLNLSSKDGARQVEYIKRQALDGAIADTYAAKIARERGIIISDEKVKEVIDSSLNTVSGKISQDVYDDSTLSTLGYTADEYRHIIKRSLTHQEVAYQVDTSASTTKQTAEKLLKAQKNPSLAKLASELKKQQFTAELGASGNVPKTNHDGGLTQTAMKLKPGQLSKFIRSTTGDGYYIVQLENINDTQLSYSYIKIPLSVFDETLKTLRKDNKIKEFITVERANKEVIRQQ